MTASAQNVPMAAEGLLREDHRLNDPSSPEGQIEEKVIRCLKGICYNSEDAMNKINKGQYRMAFENLSDIRNLLINCSSMLKSHIKSVGFENGNIA